MNESSSSTINEIDENSEYFKRKQKFLKPFNNNKHFKVIEVEQIKLKNYLINKNIKNIDFLKIDTEGYELQVLIGLEEKIKNVNLILFEHHYDKMLKKDYKFNDINDYLVENNFIQILKLKMPFRKTFEYIYENRNK